MPDALSLLSTSQSRIYYIKHGIVPVKLDEIRFTMTTNVS